MLKSRITESIKEIFKDKEYKFEVYISMKDGIQLKRMVLFEGNPQQQLDNKNFKRCVQDSIEEVIKNKFLNEDMQYDLAENIADNQKKFYVIKQDNSYEPFSIVKTPIKSIDKFSINDRDNSEGILFKFMRDSLCIWAYQHIYPTSIPNKNKKAFYSVEQGDTFIGMDKPMFPISKKVDILLINNEIITSDISLMERSFKFQGFIMTNANKSIESISKLGLVANLGKLTDYIGRSKLSYAKKMMRIKNSRVLQMTSTELLRSVQKLPRWKGKFEIDKEHIILNTYSQVESLIELLDETYTRSDVTGEEYKTDAKKWVKPVDVLQ